MLGKFCLRHLAFSRLLVELLACGSTFLLQTVESLPQLLAFLQPLGFLCLEQLRFLLTGGQPAADLLDLLELILQAAANPLACKLLTRLGELALGRIGCFLHPALLLLTGGNLLLRLLEFGRAQTQLNRNSRRFALQHARLRSQNLAQMPGALGLELRISPGLGSLALQ